MLANYNNDRRRHCAIYTPEQLVTRIQFAIISAVTRVFYDVDVVLISFRSKFERFFKKLQNYMKFKEILQFKLVVHMYICKK